MIERILYTAEATSEGGRQGHARTSDGRLSVDLDVPTEMGGTGGPGTNPEQLFAAVAKYLFRLDVNDDNFAVNCHRHDGIRRRFKQTSEAVVRLATIHRFRNFHKSRETSVIPISCGRPLGSGSLPDRNFGRHYRPELNQGKRQ